MVFDVNLVVDALENTPYFYFRSILSHLYLKTVSHYYTEARRTSYSIAR